MMTLNQSSVLLWPSWPSATLLSTKGIKGKGGKAFNNSSGHSWDSVSIRRGSPWLFREYHWSQCVVSAVAYKSIFAILNCPHISLATLGWRCHSPGRGPVWDSRSTALFATLSMYTALGDKSFRYDQESSLFVTWRHYADVIPTQWV